MKGELSPRAFWGIGIAVIVIASVIVTKLIHDSDPAAQPPIPVKKFNYGEHMRQLSAEEHYKASNAGIQNPAGQSANP